ncbi:MAG TPA: lipoyl synthase [Candidatus Merdenecus merdavium]|nr:lipoyl synthase [Candidatus Merdenecus merdavium]
MAHVRKPEWLKIEKGRAQLGKVSRTLESLHLNTVCTEAGCPNQGECYKSGTATFMLLGVNCTRSCRFCKVTTAKPEPVDPKEPEHVAHAVESMNLKHVVITSVTRDDLPDGGAKHFADTILAVRNRVPHVTIEVLIPDFKGEVKDLKTVLDASPHILNHNVETVPQLYKDVRPQAVFERSLELLKQVKDLRPDIFTKSGFMVGLGETQMQVLELLKELKNIDCDMITIGQYLQPSLQHYKVREYVHPDQFERYKQVALEMGIKCVASGPLVRSSYHAEEDLRRLKEMSVS